MSLPGSTHKAHQLNAGIGIALQYEILLTLFIDNNMKARQNAQVSLNQNVDAACIVKVLQL